MRRRSGLTAVASVAILLGMACHRPDDRTRGLTVTYEVSPSPVRVGPVTVTFTVTDASSRPVAGARLQVEADMSHAGMSPVFADATETQPGRYQSQLSLTMAGDWVILLHGTPPGGEKLERQFEVRGVRAN